MNKVLLLQFGAEGVSGRKDVKTTTPILLKATEILTDRAVKHSHPENHPHNLNTMKEVLKSNNYPVCFFESLIGKRIHQIYNTTNKAKQKITIKYKRNYAIRNLFSKLQPGSETNNQTNVIYKLSCNDCECTCTKKKAIPF